MLPTITHDIKEEGFRSCSDTLSFLCHETQKTQVLGDGNFLYIDGQIHELVCRHCCPRQRVGPCGFNNTTGRHACRQDISH